MLPTRWRDTLSLVLAGLVLVASAVVWNANQPDLGFTLVRADGRWVIGSVTPLSEAALAGIEPGDVVSGIEDGTAGGERRLSIDQALDLGYYRDLPDPVGTLLSASDTIIVETADGSKPLFFRGIAALFHRSIESWLIGLLILVGGAWWMKGGRAGSGLRDQALPMTVASAIAFLAAPLLLWGAPAGLVVATIAPPMASILFADTVAALIGSRRGRTAVVAVALICGGAAAALLVLYEAGGWKVLVPLGWSALLATTVVPMLVLTARRPLPGTPLAGADNPGPIWLVAAAAFPAIAVLPQLARGGSEWAVGLLFVPWLLALVLGRAVGRSLARARLQRDLVVTVTEAERARLANELHDVALQELTLLVRRLDASGQTDAADMARSVSERLRELCGELHLPILDELGAGPALDWLVGQVAGATGEEIRLERSDPVRPPAGVELAVFRVAQEAISNAVKHGGPPVVVRYATTPSAASLFVDDAGPGMDPGPEWDLGRRRIEPKPGHYGLASMQQRAEQIGALLSIRAWPTGGTRVSLEWRAP
jgi:signal transduction histidine kinase